MSQSNLTQQNIFIIGNDSLFDAGIEQMLTRKTNLHVSRATYSDDFAFLNDIGLDQPDVLLVCESGSMDTEHILNLVLSYAILTELRIVVVRLHNNLIDVYARSTIAENMSDHQLRITAKTEDDLLSVFQDDLLRLQRL